MWKNPRQRLERAYTLDVGDEGQKSATTELAATGTFTSFRRE